MTSEFKLGTTPSPDTVYLRDAVHVAVIVVKAGTVLQPGQRVSVTAALEAWPAMTTYHGIVDPFLNGLVDTDELFYLCMVPGSTSLPRHHWEHPTIPSPANPTVAELRAQINELEIDLSQARCGC